MTGTVPLGCVGCSLDYGTSQKKGYVLYRSVAVV